MPVHAARYYYLDNFRRVLAWLRQRYDDLLTQDERGFVDVFSGIPVESSALLVRMVTRRGTLFRNSKLVYEEIGCARHAAAPLIAAGFVDPAPSLAWPEVQRLLTKAELAAAFEIAPEWRRARKPQLVEHLQASGDAMSAVTAWLRRVDETIYQLAVAPLCERFRLLFFGNFRQDWSEFVLTDLGIFRYERVALDAAARAFHTRAEIDQFAALYRCRELLHAECAPEQVLANIPPPLAGCAWIEARRARLLFQVGQRFEKARHFPQALGVYLTCGEPDATARASRVLEKLERWSEARDLLQTIDASCASEALLHDAERMRPRLCRKLGPDESLSIRRARVRHAWSTFEVEIPPSPEPVPVERLAAEHLSSPQAPVMFVENALLNSLLGLSCWEAIFAPLPGAFFHEFQAAPADLLAPDFYSRRAHEFAACFARFESGEYRDCVLRTYAEKSGTATPFVAWDSLTPELLTLALECIPPEHLLSCFARILSDIRANRAGLPDLIQFFPRERRYRLIEVKGPGDRLQNNQVRWLGFCVDRQIDVAVCKVKWRAALA